MVAVIGRCDSEDPAPLPVEKGHAGAIETRADLDACMKRLGESGHRRDAKDRLKKLRPAPEWVVTRLVERLQDGDSAIRYAAAEALGMVVGSGQAHVAPLVTAVSDKEPLVRVAAIGAFAELLERGLHRHDQEVKRALVAAVADPDEFVRVMAIIAFAALLERDLHRHDQEVKRALVAALADPDEDVRRWAAQACLSVGPMASNDGPRYFAVARDPNADVRIFGLHLIASTAKDHSEVEEILLAALADKDPCIRAHAAGALSTYQDDKGTERVVAALTEALVRETDDHATESIDLAMAYIGHEHCELIARHLKGASKRTKLRLLTVLWRLQAPTHEARALVAPLADSPDSEVNAAAKKVIKAWKPRGGRD